MKKLLIVLLLAAVGACATPVLYFSNAIHPERDFEMDKYDCAVTATQRMAAGFPQGRTVQNWMWYDLAFNNVWRQCLASRGWQEVEQ